jgi:outer membrane protein OmpA-like peptidoglycan-associated protein
MRTKRSALLLTAAIAFTGLAMAACESEPMASVAYVDMKTSGLKGEIDQLNGQVQTLNTQVAQANATAQQASAKADEAGRKAAGDFEHKVLFTDDSIMFDTSKSELSQEDQAKLTAFVQKLKTDNQNVYIEIQGHADNRGNPGYNMALGARRADAVRRYLVDQGVPTYRLSTISYGEEKPKGPNDTAQGRDMNRRAVLVVEN